MTVDVRYLVHDVDAAADSYLMHLGFTEAEPGAPVPIADTRRPPPVGERSGKLGGAADARRRAARLQVGGIASCSQSMTSRLR
jgi:hypothetical protein